jgi:APA family basic amino acid/polyamine antiporter
MSSGIASASTLARAFAGDYLGEFVDLPLVLAAIGLILILAAINLRGISESVGVNVVLTADRPLLLRDDRLRGLGERRRGDEGP